MGDLNFFIKNSPPLIWLALFVILIIVIGLFFKSMEAKSSAVIFSLLFAFSLIVFVAYLSLHPILCLLLALFWLVMIIVNVVNIMPDKQKDQFQKAAQEKERIKFEKMKAENEVKCPYCGSHDVDFMQNNRKSFSAGKAVAGTALAGPVGSVAGFAGKKGKNQYLCKSCSRTFEK